MSDPNKAEDLEKLREWALMRECESKQKRMKEFRLEAVRVGFKKAWQERDYATTIIIYIKLHHQRVRPGKPKSHYQDSGRL